MKCVFISKEKSFITESILMGLKDAGIECITMEPGVKELEKRKNDTDMILLVADNTISKMTNELVFIKDVCADDAKNLYLAGYPDEIDKIEFVIPRELVKKEFVRPFDIKKLVSYIADDAKNLEKRQKGKKLLLVDDDVTFLKMVKKWLMGKYQVTVVKSGIQAIKYIAGHKPDLILMDYDMPITTGSKVLEMIRSESESADIPVIFLTGKADRETVMQVMSLKPQGYLLKTMSQAEIVAAIDNYFETQKWQNVGAIMGNPGQPW